MRRRASRLLVAAGAIILGAGGALLGQQAYLDAKASLAAVLIDRAWQAHLRDGREHRPWEWADVVPRARLIVPRLGIDRPVLSGASGGALAFGLGHLDGTAAPCGPGLCAIAGHRDTWGAFLREIVSGDEIVLRTRDHERRYRVARIEIVDRGEMSVLEPVLDDRLVLVTCYPFGALRGGPLRYVVTGLPDLSSTEARATTGPRGAGRSGTSRP